MQTPGELGIQAAKQEDAMRFGKFIAVLETMDPQDDEFQQYLAAHGIAARPTGKVHGQPGGGEDVEYRASTREALESLINYWFLSGDDEADSNLFTSILAVGN